jgi:hypothetical protein
VRPSVKIIIFVVCIFVLIINPILNAFLPYGWFDMVIHPPRFVEIELEEVAFSYFEPSEHIRPVIGAHWDIIGIQERANTIACQFDLILPNIDFETEMFIVSMGSELERLDFDLNDPRYRERGEFIGFPVFSRNFTYDLIVVYRTDVMRITDAERAGFITPYMGRGREHGNWGWGFMPRRNQSE